MFLKSFLFGISLFLGGCILYAQDNDPIITAVKKIHAQYEKAVETKDSVFVKQLFHDKMMITGGDGTRRNKKAEIMDLVNPIYVVTYFKTNNVEVDAFKDVAILRGDLEWELKQGDKPYVIRRRITFTYMKSGNQWQIIAQHIGLPPRG
jgi:hypothetical protein